MKGFPFSRPPNALRRAKLDNLAIVPASLLPLKEKWQQIANSLPEDGVLIILPLATTPQRKTLENVVTLLESKGHKVTTISVERFS
ncbi:MAG: hypothetical protein M1358_25105 [Chloroflexi bacterium]|nr:hypothetical protein [Chloroflexota bacterium]